MTGREAHPAPVTHCCEPLLAGWTNRDRDRDYDETGRYGDDGATTRRGYDDDAQDDPSTPPLRGAARMVDCRWSMTDRVRRRRRRPHHLVYSSQRTLPPMYLQSLHPIPHTRSHQPRRSLNFSPPTSHTRPTQEPFHSVVVVPALYSTNGRTFHSSPISGTA
jgi:hypothetical protein